MSANNNDQSAYNGRGGNSYGYNNRGRYNNNFFGRGGFNDFNANWRAPRNAPPAMVASAAPLESFYGQLPSAIDGAASGQTLPRHDALVPDTIVATSNSPSAAVTNNIPVTIHTKEVANVSSAFSSSSSDNTVGGENVDISANNIVIHAPTPKRVAVAPNLVNRGFASIPNTPSFTSVAPVPIPAADPAAQEQTKHTEQVSDKTLKKADEACALMNRENTLSLLEELDGADAAQLRKTLEKIHASKSNKVASLKEKRAAITAALITACGLVQNQERGVSYHHDRFVRKFEESLYVKNKESKMALQLQANESIREAQRYGHYARQNRQKIEELRNEVTALDAKLFKACELSCDTVLASMKWAIDRAEANKKSPVAADDAAESSIFDLERTREEEGDKPTGPRQVTGQSIYARHPEKIDTIGGVFESMEATEKKLGLRG